MIWSAFLGLDSHGLARVMDDGIGILFRSNAHAMIAPNPDHMEGALRQHSRKTAFTRSQRQPLCRLIPAQGNGGIRSAFVVVVITLVFVEVQRTICAAIH